MKITFEQKDEKEVLIKANGKTIGHIFTPAGTGHNKLNAIQVCGFDRAFMLWGCGIFADEKTGKQKQDIQLLYNENSEQVSGKFAVDSDCGRCFNKQTPIPNIMGDNSHGSKCTCDELEIAKEKDLNIEKEAKK